MNIDWSQQLAGIVTTIIFFVLCGILFLFSIWVMERVTPFSIRKEIEEDQNTALGIVIGAALIGIAIVLHGVLTS